jgi:hypothetical protein
VRKLEISSNGEDLPNASPEEDFGELFQASV